MFYRCIKLICSFLCNCTIYFDCLCILWDETIFKNVISMISSISPLRFIIKMTHDSELTHLMVFHCLYINITQFTFVSICDAIHTEKIKIRNNLSFKMSFILFDIYVSLLYTVIYSLNDYFLVSQHEKLLLLYPSDNDLFRKQALKILFILHFNFI